MFFLLLMICLLIVRFVRGSKRLVRVFEFRLVFRDVFVYLVRFVKR